MKVLPKTSVWFGCFCFSCADLRTTSLEACGGGEMRPDERAHINIGEHGLRGAGEATRGRGGAAGGGARGGAPEHA